MPDVMTLEAAEMSLDRRSDLQKEVDKIILEDVKRGMKLLREKYGEDWVNHIDPMHFQMWEGSVCVLGQVVPALDPEYDKNDGTGYDWACERWSNENEEFTPISFGFNARDYDELERDDEDDPVHGAAFEQLQRVWETVFEMVGIKKG